MKVIYIPKTPFGEFFFDPESRQGVGLNEDGFSVVGVDKRYDPNRQPGCQELDVPSGTFDELKNSALMYEGAKAGIYRTLRHFPDNPDRPMPGLTVRGSRVGKDAEYQDVLSMSIGVAFEKRRAVSCRVRNALRVLSREKDHEIRTLGDLTRVTERELKMRNLGKITLKYVKEQLARYDLELAKDF